MHVLGRLVATLQCIPPILAGCPVRRPVLARVLRQGGRVRVQGGRAPARLAPALGHGSVLALITKLPLTLGAVHILRKHILGSLNTLGGVVSAW